MSGIRSHDVDGREGAFPAGVPGSRRATTCKKAGLSGPTQVGRSRDCSGYWVNAPDGQCGLTVVGGFGFGRSGVVELDVVDRGDDGVGGERDTHNVAEISVFADL